MHERPGLWRNLLAMVYDTFLVAPLLMVNGLILVTVFGPTADAHKATVPAWLMQITSLVIIITFFTLFWRKSGQTLGMQAWRIKLIPMGEETISEGGADQSEVQQVSYAQCVLRCLAAMLSLAPAGLGYWWSLVDPEHLRWHDRLSNTRLVKVPKRQKDGG